MQFAGGPVRGFLWSVADTDARADFESFVKIYDALDESLPPSNILELTAELFPGPTDGRRLKKSRLRRSKDLVNSTHRSKGGPSRTCYDGSLREFRSSRNCHSESKRLAC